MEVSAYRNCRFIPGERKLGAHYIGSWVGPRWALGGPRVSPRWAPGGPRVGPREDSVDAMKNDKVTSYADIRKPIPQFTAHSIVNILNAIFRLLVKCITGHLR
jgi:hypothetical protein